MQVIPQLLFASSAQYVFSARIFMLFAPERLLPACLPLNKAIKLKMLLCKFPFYFLNIFTQFTLHNWRYA